MGVAGVVILYLAVNFVCLPGPGSSWIRYNDDSGLRRNAGSARLTRCTMD